MSVFRFGRVTGGSFLGTAAQLGGDDGLVADVEASAALAGALTTAIPLSGAVDGVVTVQASMTTQKPLAGAAAAQASVSGTLTDYIVPKPVKHARREYEQYVRGPVGAIAYRFGTRAALRGGAWHTSNIAAFSELQDVAVNDFGIIPPSGFTLDLVSNAAVAVDLAGVGAALRNQVCEVDLVTRFLAADSSVIQELIHTRRATVSRVVQRRNVLTLTLVDLDRAALEQIFPLERFTVEDWPELFAGHVGRRVPQGVGTVVRVPLTWVKKTGGTHKFAGPKVLGAPGTLLTVYRGTQPGNGSVVNTSEYTAGTLAAAVTAGLTVNTVEFATEQLDFQGRPHVLEADYLLPGDRQPSQEIQRIFAACAIPTFAGSFADARAYDLTQGFAADCLYGGDNDGRRTIAIVQDLLQVARGWLSQLATGEWTIMQDRARLPILELSSKADQVDVEEYGDSEAQKSVTVEYRPKASGSDQHFQGLLERPAAGTSGVLTIKNRYIRDHGTADRLASYHQKRINSLKRASALVHAVQLAIGEVITITDPVHWAGKKHFMAEALSRPADYNAVQLREYEGSIHDYTPGDLPDGATNDYGPDYTYTPPAAPTGGAVVSQGIIANTDGLLQAWALVRAVPPSVNWAELWALVIDTGTGEQHPAPMQLNAGNYETVIGTLRPNRSHTVEFYARNAAGLPGVHSATVGFASANDTALPSAPASPTIQQTQSFELEFSWAKVADVAGRPKIRHYIPKIKAGAGAFVNGAPVESGLIKLPGVSHGTAYQAKVSAVDMNGNESADSSTVSITPTRMIDDSYIVGLGVSGASIAGGSITRGKTFNDITSVSVTVAPGADITLDYFTFFPQFTNEVTASPCYLKCVQGASADDQGLIGFFTTNTGGDAVAEFRSVQP